MDITLDVNSIPTDLLHTKYNQLVDFCNRYIQETVTLKEAKKELEEQCLFLHQELVSCTNRLAKYPADFSDTLPTFFMDFNAIIRDLEKNGAFIPYTYVSQNAKNYLKVEKSIFDHCVSQHTNWPLKTFRYYCMQFLLIKSEGSACVFNSNKLRIYYINKAAVACVQNDAIPESL